MAARSKNKKKGTAVRKSERILKKKTKSIVKKKNEKKNKNNNKKKKADVAVKNKKKCNNKKEVDIVREGVMNEVFKNARRHYPRRKVIIKGLDETFSADLLDMQEYSENNDGYRYILMVMDNFSKYAWAVPLKAKTGPDTTAGMEKIFKEGKRIPKKMWTDNGTEFFNKEFKALMKKHNIELYHTHSEIKNPLIERLNRTFRHKIHPRLWLQGNNKWVNILKEVVDEYNNTRHRTIKMSPADVNKSNEKKILNSVYRNIKVIEKPKFKVGDYVRLSTTKLTFEKGYTQNYSFEVFKITKVKMTNPRTYLLEDVYHKPVAGQFYEQELIKTDFAKKYVLEEILRKVGKRYLVKFLGYPNPEWINQKDFL